MQKIGTLAIIGAGPAGLSSAIYGARLGFEVKIFEKTMPGGLMLGSGKIENYPGFYEGIDGQELAENMRKHAERYGCEIIYEEVKNIDVHGGKKIIKTDSKTYEANAIIIATGMRHRKLGLPNEENLIGRGISFCAVCDAPLYRDKKVVVVGCGSAGIKEGLYLAQYAREIKFVEILEDFTAEPILVDEIKKLDNVEFYFEHKVVELRGKDRLESVIIENIKTGEHKVFSVDGLFEYIGEIPNTDFIKGLIDLTEKGFIITDGTLQTNVPGIFACGDVRDTKLRQVATAVGDGTLAAYSAYWYVKRLKD